MGAMSRWEESNNLPGRYLVAVLLCLTLGLAPFSPEPHLVGKVRWVAGGGQGMGAIDILDLLMHGLPWGLLVALVVVDLARRARQ